jgi:hypothetical protein
MSMIVRDAFIIIAAEPFRGCFFLKKLAKCREKTKYSLGNLDFHD